MVNSTVKKKQQEDEIDLSFIVKALRGKWHYYLIAVVLFVALALAYFRFTLPIYQVQSSILVEDPKLTSKNIEDLLSGDVFGSPNTLATEIGILGSHTVIERTIDQLGLQVSYMSQASFPAQPLYNSSPFVVK